MRELLVVKTASMGACDAKAPLNIESQNSAAKSLRCAERLLERASASGLSLRIAFASLKGFFRADMMRTV